VQRCCSLTLRGDKANTAHRGQPSARLPATWTFTKQRCDGASWNWKRADGDGAHAHGLQQRLHHLCRTAASGTPLARMLPLARMQGGGVAKLQGGGLQICKGGWLHYSYPETI
jgi:hypothetical protein